MTDPQFDRVQPGVGVCGVVGGQGQQPERRGGVGRRLQCRRGLRAVPVGVVEDHEHRPRPRRPHQAGELGGFGPRQVHDGTAGVGVVGEFGGQPGPSAFGRAGNQHHPATPLLRISPQPAQAGHRVLAGDKQGVSAAQLRWQFRRACRTRFRCRQDGILREHGRLHGAQLRPGFHADLSDEVTAGPLEGEQGVTLPPAAVQREHQLRPQSLPQRMLAYQALQLGGHLGVSAQRQAGLDPGLQRGQPRLFQPSGLRGTEQCVLEVRVRGAPPHSQRGAQRNRGDVGRAGGRGLAGPCHQIGELQCINVVAGGAKHVPGPLPRHGAVPAVRCQHLAHPDDIYLHRFGGAERGVVPPQCLDDVPDRDHAISARQQKPQKPPLLDPPDRHLAAGRPHLKRPQHAEPHSRA
jgi:hypothetical protein